MARVQEQLKFVVESLLFVLMNRFLPELRVRALREVGADTHHIQAVEVWW